MMSRDEWPTRVLTNSAIHIFLEILESHTIYQESTGSTKIIDDHDYWVVSLI